MRVGLVRPAHGDADDHRAASEQVQVGDSRPLTGGALHRQARRLIAQLGNLALDPGL